jgi:apolipoprotein N-acyltransferase
MPRARARGRAVGLLAGAVSGVLVAAAYPPARLWLVALVGLVPWLLHLERLADAARAGERVLGRAFGSGWALALVLYVALLWWIVVLDSPTLTIPWIRWLAPVLIAAFMGIFPGLASLGIVWVRARTRVPLVLIAPAAWTVAELVRGRGELGFPWGALGYSQVPFLPALQIAAVAGVSGLGAWVVAVNALATRSLRPGVRPVPALAWAAVLVVVPVLGGAVRLSGADGPHETLRVALVQPNVRNDEKWLPENRDRIFAALAELTRQGVAGGADLVLWPETAAPCYLLKDRTWYPFVADLAESLATPILLGLPDYQIESTGAERRVTYTNTAALFDRYGGAAGRMDKIRLVPFGEYVPFAAWIPLLEKVDFGEADFRRGKGPVLFAGEGSGVELPAFANLICLEAVFPDLARRCENLGARLLVNITNDSWFGAGSGAVLHRDMALVRCVETGCGMARCANSGISVGIDPWGRRSGETGLFVEGVSVVDVVLREGRTPWARRGDWPTGLSLAIVGLALGLAAFAPRRLGAHSPGAGR